MNSSAIIGALLGGAGGYFLGKGDLLYTGVGAVGGAVVGVGLGATVASAAQLPAPPASVQSNGAIVLSSGTPTMTVGLMTGLPVTIQLPPGAAWTSGNQTPSPPGSSSPVTWTYTGPGSVTLDWTDSNSNPQETTLTFYTSTV